MFHTFFGGKKQGLVNVPIEHHPNIGDIISNKYLRVMFKITKMGHLPTLEQILRKPSDPAKEPRQTSSDPPPRSGVVVTNDESPTMMALYSTKWAYSAMMYIYICVCVCFLV